MRTFTGILTFMPYEISFNFLFYVQSRAYEQLALSYSSRFPTFIDIVQTACY